MAELLKISITPSCIREYPENGPGVDVFHGCFASMLGLSVNVSRGIGILVGTETGLNKRCELLFVFCPVFRLYDFSMLSIFDSP